MMGMNTARQIVDHLFDLAEVSVEKRQAINDEADVYVASMLPSGLRPECLRCGFTLTEPGGLLFSHPIATDVTEQADVVLKDHLCLTCTQEVRVIAMNHPKAGRR